MGRITGQLSITVWLASQTPFKPINATQQPGRPDCQGPDFETWGSGVLSQEFVPKMRRYFERSLAVLLAKRSRNTCGCFYAQIAVKLSRRGQHSLKVALILTVDSGAVCIAWVGNARRIKPVAVLEPDLF